MNREQDSNLSIVQSLAAVNLTINNTTVAGGAIDLQGFDSATICADIGTWGDTVAGGMMEFAVQHSDDTVSGNFTDVADTDLTDTVTLTSTVSGGAATGGFAKVTGTSDDAKVVKTGYKGGKRYIRHKINGEKNLATGTPVSITVIKGNPHVAPTS